MVVDATTPSLVLLATLAVAFLAVRGVEVTLRWHSRRYRTALSAPLTAVAALRLPRVVLWTRTPGPLAASPDPASPRGCGTHCDVRTANLGLKFVLELAAFAALAVAGARLGSGIGAVVLAVVLPVVAIAVWGRWNAPGSAHRLPTGPCVVCELVVFGAAAVLLAVSGAPGWAVVFVVLVVVNALLLTVFGQWEG